jgi:hypothetical protein
VIESTVFIAPAVTVSGPPLLSEMPALLGTEFTVTEKLVLAVIFPVSLTPVIVTV